MRPLLVLALAALLPAADLAPTFLKADGWHLRDHGGTGEAIPLRGVNLGGWLVQEAWMTPLSSTIPDGANWWRQDLEAYLLTRFNLSTKNTLVQTWQQNWITSRDFDGIAAMGYNFVRLPFSFLDFMEAEPATVALEDVAWKPDTIAFARLDWAIEQAAARGMYVLLDMHEVQGKPIDPFQHPNSFWNTPAYQDRAVEIWKKIAARYVGNPTVIGYDLLNEPWSTAITYYDRCYQAIRPIDPDHPLFLETWGWENLPVLSSKGWNNVVVSLHYYPSSGDTLGQQIEDHLAELRNIRDTQQASGRYVPIHIGEFFLNGGNQDHWRRLVRGYADLGVSWNKWTWKTHTVSAWGNYQRKWDPADPLDATATPDVTVDDEVLIAADWSRWVTPAPTTTNWSHLDSTNRRHLAGPVVDDVTVDVPASGTLFVRDADLLDHTTCLVPDADLRIVERTDPDHGTWYPVAGGGLFVADPGFTGTATLTYRVQERPWDKSPCVGARCA